MDYFEKLKQQVFIFAGSLIFGLSLAVSIVAVYGSSLIENVPQWLILLLALLIGGLGAYAISKAIVSFTLKPIDIIRRAVLHVTPNHSEFNPPDLDKNKIGKDLITGLVLQIYQLASTQKEVAQHLGAAPAKSEPAIDKETVLNSLPVPVFVVNRDSIITSANLAAARYLNKNINDLKNDNFYSALDLAFTSEDTLDSWLENCRDNKATDTHSWDRVRLNNDTKKQFDLSAYYTKDSSDKTEFIAVLFDKSAYYGADNDSVSFIALAVHELRTPVTMLRGYIEVFEDEFSDKLTPELTNFMHKMQTAAKQLSAFISNILNVARIEENQLFLRLNEDSWEQTLKSFINDMAMQAGVYGKKLEFNIQPNLPSVAIDRISMYEVVNNLIDNAIKYSDKSDRIIIRSYLRDDGMIETTIQDFGIGVPSNIIGNLFEKFYRNHRSRSKFGGTGLGLYICKSIINAHGGQVWVQSKEGQGSIFGFSLQQYSQLADSQKSADNQDIQRTAHGWIKNHSFYRR